MSEINEKDLEILKVLQENCRLRAKEISKKVKTPISTVFAKIKRMEKEGIIKAYKAQLDSRKLEKGATAFILVQFEELPSETNKSPTQRDVAREIGKFKEVQEVHIITGQWDMVLKVRAKDVDAIGKFVIDKLRYMKGVKRTSTSMVFETEKETMDLL
jgi:DNA-binding Lrp family transcriptional regulator